MAGLKIDQKALKKIKIIVGSAEEHVQHINMMEMLERDIVNPEEINIFTGHESKTPLFDRAPVIVNLIETDICYTNFNQTEEIKTTEVPNRKYRQIKSTSESTISSSSDEKPKKKKRKTTNASLDHDFYRNNIKKNKCSKIRKSNEIKYAKIQRGLKTMKQDKKMSKSSTRYINYFGSVGNSNVSSSSSETDVNIESSDDDSLSTISSNDSVKEFYKNYFTQKTDYVEFKCDCDDCEYYYKLKQKIERNAPTSHKTKHNTSKKDEEKEENYYRYKAALFALKVLREAVSCNSDEDF